MFLEVLTRCFRRPGLLAANQASLAAQTCADWTQTLLVDEEGRGIAWSYANMAAYGPRLAGEYVWILDDDDLCVRATLTAELRELAERLDPDVIMLRMDHGALGVLPDDARWGQRPQCGRIGVSAFVVRRATWQECAGAMVSGAGYTADYALIEAIWDSTPRVVWHDVVASRVQRISRGEPE